MLAPNTTLQGRYRIVRQLGQGGMGTVYEAKALRLNTTVALKETHFTDERLRRQFEREAQLLANLRHAALPRVIDHFDERDGLYLVMDFIEGDDLWEMLRKRGAPFPASDVISWAGQLLDALGYLHAQSPPVIHRDIKPQNLKLTDDGRLILLDFGLAKGMSEGAPSIISSRTVMGFSLPYAPLEQILQIDENSREQLSVLNPQEVERIRRTGTGQRSDIYSVGATLLHLLTAKVPNTSPTRAISIWSNRAENYMGQRGSFIAPIKPQPKYWLSFRVERGFEFGVHNILCGREISVELYLSGSDVRSHFHLLHRDREQIERQIGTSLEWQEKPTQKNSRVIIRNRSNVDPKNRQDWPRQHEWLLDKLEAFHKVFAPRIRAIRAEDQLEGWTG
jgi:serine/threonine protein kinase